MKKLSISLLICLSMITLTGSVFAQSTTITAGAETSAERNGDYSTFVAPVEYSSEVQPSNSGTTLLPWERRAAERNGDYYKFIATK